MKDDSTTAKGRAGERKGWLDDPRNVNKIVYALYAVCGLLLTIDLFFHRHSHFSFEGWFGFYGFFGFLAFVAVVLAGKVLRKLLMRPEDYYDR